MARRLAEGHGLTTALKWHFFDHGPVVRPAVVERPSSIPPSVAWCSASFPERYAPCRRQTLALAAVNTARRSPHSIPVVLAPVAWRRRIFVLPAGRNGTLALSEQLFLSLWRLLLLPGVTSPATRGGVRSRRWPRHPPGPMASSSLLALPCLLAVRRHRRALPPARRPRPAPVLLPLYAWIARAPEMSARGAGELRRCISTRRPGMVSGRRSHLLQPSSPDLGAVAARSTARWRRTLYCGYRLFPLPLLLLLRAHTRPADPTPLLCRAGSLAVAASRSYSSPGLRRSVTLPPRHHPSSSLLLSMASVWRARRQRGGCSAHPWSAPKSPSSTLGALDWSIRRRAGIRWNRRWAASCAGRKWIEELAGSEDVGRQQQPVGGVLQTCRPAVGPFFRDRADLTRPARRQLAFAGFSSSPTP